MKIMTKITLVSASILGMGALTACQSNPSPKEGSEGRRMADDKSYRMTPEQREERKQLHAQRKEMREQIQKACNGKTIGQSVQIQAGQQTIDGTCKIIFKADRSSLEKMKRDFHQDGERMRHDGPRFKDMTDEQRVQIRQQFEQKRAERKAQWDAVQQACAGQTNNQAIQVKLGDKTLDGKCIVKFQPDFKANNQMTAIPPKA